MPSDRLDLAETDPWRVHEPRVVGGLYYSGYWQEFYVVLGRHGEGPAGSTWMTCLWLGKQDSSGKWIEGTERVTRHMTAWDWSRDKEAEFNFVDPSWESSYVDYDEFIAVMRDCADYAVWVTN